MYLCDLQSRNRTRYLIS